MVQSVTRSGERQGEYFALRPVNSNAKTVGNAAPVEKKKLGVIGEKKREADIADLKEDKDEGKENATPSTPPKSKNPAILERNLNTPGRLGPIREYDPNYKPDIKPFKGPKGKEDENRQFGLENEGHAFHELYVCYSKGPNGSPTYDKAGFVYKCEGRSLGL